MKKKLNTYIDRISKNIYISKTKNIYIYKNDDHES